MAPEITFALSDEQQQLRDTARRFLKDRSGPEKVREDMRTDRGFDDALWSETAQMGWQAMAVPEEFGGAGYGWGEVAVLMEEMGRALWCAPFLSSAVLGTAVLLAGGSDEQKKEHLPGLAAGETRATVVHLASENHVSVTDGKLSGRADYVLDGHTADLILVPADDGSVHLVRGDADGLTRELLPVLDLTRKQATLAFDDVAAEPLGDADHEVVDRALVIGATMLAVEQVGGAQKVFESSLEYAKTRKQFGRAIGSFQAIKHRLADTLKDVESARSVAYHAAQTLGRGDFDELEVAAPLAASYCAEVYERAAAHNIQNHGGIGFTWEHDAHLYFKRAKTAKLLFGGPTAWRTRLADTLGF